MHTLNTFNQLSKQDASHALFKCCGSQAWVDQLMDYFPFKDEKLLFEQSRKIWYNSCTKDDYLQAFTHHPKIGDLENLSKKFAETKDWAGNEQAGVNTAQQQTVKELARLNEVYFQQFGYIFIVCATGKSAAEMLKLLSHRAKHTSVEELGIAMGEQFKITLIRLKKLIAFEAPFWNAASQITTHVLDTAIGQPGQGICIKLKAFIDDRWQTISLGITNADGRIGDLLPAGKNLATGHYQMCFDTKTYFDELKTTGFYPSVDINFTTFDETHYHVPLLINPFGYSTYRGS